jgi:transposase-like protein
MEISTPDFGLRRQSHYVHAEHKRYAKASKRFFKNISKASHSSNPRAINMDKNAVYPHAVSELKEDGPIRNPATVPGRISRRYYLAKSSAHK